MAHASAFAANHIPYLQFWRFIPDEAVLDKALQYGRVVGFKRMGEDMCYLDFASEDEAAAALMALDGHRVWAEPEYRLRAWYKVI